jgi:hypothetical protein
MAAVLRVMAGLMANAETTAALRATYTKAMMKQYFWLSEQVKEV